MPPAVTKSKPKGKDGRQSRSRNTTPGSAVSAPLTSSTPSHSAISGNTDPNLMVPSNISYGTILERHVATTGIPDPSHLETITNDLKTLAQLASVRSDANNKGMRDLSERRKLVLEEEREREHARIQAEAEKGRLQKEAEDEEERERKRKERSIQREERPLNVGAHGLARQDGLNLPLEVSPSRSAKHSSSPILKPDPSHASSSPLSEASQVQSPAVPAPAAPIIKADSPDTDESSDTHQPPKALAEPQAFSFGANPLTFDDPTIYEIRDVTDDMTDEEKKEIYCVAAFPPSDLRDLIAGTPPNKDYSNAVKPNNQVQAHTFAGYLDGYLRPLKEEDIGFLNERGDRMNPFLMPPRGKRHYSEIWAAETEENHITFDESRTDRLPPNQARGSLEDMDDAVAETDQVSSGPLVSRLLSTMRFEHRTPPEEKPQTNGVTNGDTSMTNGDLPNGMANDPEPSQESNTNGSATKQVAMPSATYLPENARPPANLSTHSHSQIDERLKTELRHIGILPPDEEPNFDAHEDDEVAERLRWLQDRLKKVSVMNGARKRRVLELAEEQLAYQEYSTILEDLDSQVQQAYLKRARTAGKSKKNTKRPGSISGTGVGANGAGGAPAVGKPGIGDVARQLMNRRARWEEKIGPVFREDVRRVRGKGEGIFGERELEKFTRAEREMFDEEQDV
ncbi:uncharacterized protein KY384_001616 [Bacidia gigantensis]|uniref:uncharacterized protein n=1 Tax=Bacidia gigantensis TaxID=2732470 RepID=UPI001D057B71|nr:uncharacterized protein KY384_001616 [Bacidia gigantensis]KAG8533875.1 hypothetical protein KY384_001616 [Bacidia gigantensis]